MKWSFVIQQKLKAALLLSGIMLMIILGAFISRSNMRGIDRSFLSIYQDRLIPATTIIYLSENLYGKRLLLEKFLLSAGEVSREKIAADLRAHDKDIDSLIHIFGKTYLVDEEVKSLNAFKIHVGKYAALEKEVLELENLGNRAASRNLFESAGSGSFHETILDLNKLTVIQSSIGKELMNESKSDMANVWLISFLQIALAVIVGLSILILIQSSNMINSPKVPSGKDSYFNLN